MKSDFAHRATRAMGVATLLAACAAKDDGRARSFNDPLPALPGAKANEANQDWVLVFGDEFDTGTLDASKWFAKDGDPKHKGTLNSVSPAMAATHDGSLFVSAKPTPADPAFPYTTGYILTEGRFAQTYGKIEFRMRGAYAPGLWYAVWGRPWIHQIPEFDVEFLAENINQVWFVNHWDVPPLPADERRAFVTVEGMDITEFHTYAITWTSELVEWRIDGKPYMRATGKGVAHEPLVWTINAWVGGWAGAVSPSTILPAGFEIDYFRVYRPRKWPADPAIRIATTKRNYYLADTLDIDVADLDRGAVVEVWEGDARLETLAGPPFEYSLSHLTRGEHALTFVGTDGARRASTSWSEAIQ